MGGIDRDLLRDGVAYVDHWVAYQQDRRDLPGVVVAIQCADQLVFARGYGYADLERQIPMTPQHIFRVASHSKRRSPPRRSCSSWSRAPSAWTTG